jgi:hypothetical protein
LVRVFRALLSVVLAAVAVAAGVIVSTGAAQAAAHTAVARHAAHTAAHPAAVTRPAIAVPTARTARARRGADNPPQLTGNWSGYDATGGINQFTNVTSNWVQPAVNCNFSGQVANWVGLDGALRQADPTVEQTGTTADCTSGSPRYFGWYEFAPQPPVNFGGAVQPGDNMTATVTYVGNNDYTLDLRDITQNWNSNTTVQSPFTAQNSSAEVIAEAPSECSPSSCSELPLVDFGYTGFAGSAINGESLAAAGAQGFGMIDPSGGSDSVSNPDAAGFFTVVYGDESKLTGSPEIAFQSNYLGGNQLWNETPSAYGFMGQRIMSGTSPSITALAGGGWEEAYQSQNGLLVVIGTDFSFNSQLGMLSGTSPSIAASPNGGFQVAFQANTGTLWYFTPQSGGASQGYSMASGTSPSITALAGGGYETAFQASTGLLWEVGTYSNFNTELGMRGGTSPSISPMPNVVFEVAFQANTSTLWTQNLAVGGVSQGLGMTGGSSPAILG